MALTDLLVILCVSLTSTLIAEAISWLLIYRTDSYKELKLSIDRLTAKPFTLIPILTGHAVEKRKETSAGMLGSRREKGQKKIERFEEELKAQNQALSFTKFKSTFAVMFTMMSLFGLMSSHFDGIVVARLPFEPFSLLRTMSHRNLPGDDYYDCAFIFFYALCGVSIRSTVQKMLGVTPPRSAPSMFSGGK